MSTARLGGIDRVMALAINAGGFPGAAVIVGRHGAIVWERGYGRLDRESSQAVDPERSIYDLASLTKVVATAAAVMLLVDRRQLQLDATVAEYLPDFRGGDRGRVTVRDLLTHRSGLPAGRDLMGRDVASMRATVLRTPLAHPPGERGEYSDVGPEILGFLVERITGVPLDRLLQENLYAPLGMRSTFFRPSPRQRATIAPTHGRGARGEVHDANARLLGGVAGHAGLFASAGDLAVFAEMMLGGGTFDGARVLSDSSVAQFTQRSVGWRALGWETCAGGGACGRYFGPTAYGHNGFTGTSLWIDPVRDLVVIVLTNWVEGGEDGRVAPVAVLHDVRSDVADLAALAVSDQGSPLAMPSQLRSDVQLGWRR